jgi:S-adenosylmethionine synthetase
MARFAAKNIVANGYAKECTVSVAYQFGEENPIMLCASTDVPSSDSKITSILNNAFDFRPQAIIERLNLRKTNYRPTSTYGHFTDSSYPWEKIIRL